MIVATLALTRSMQRHRDEQITLLQQRRNGRRQQRRQGRGHAVAPMILEGVDGFAQWPAVHAHGRDSGERCGHAPVIGCTVTTRNSGIAIARGAFAPVALLDAVADETNAPTICTEL